MTTRLGTSCSFGLPRVPFVNCCQFMYLVISLLVLRAGCGIWLYGLLIIAYLFTLSMSGLCQERAVIQFLPRVPFVNCCQFMYLVISLLVLRAGCGIWLYQVLIIAYLFTLYISNTSGHLLSTVCMSGPHISNTSAIYCRSNLVQCLSMSGPYISNTSAIYFCSNSIQFWVRQVHISQIRPAIYLVQCFCQIYISQIRPAIHSVFVRCIYLKYARPFT